MTSQIEKEAINIFDLIDLEDDFDYEELGKQMLEHAEYLVRRDDENYRLKLQTSMFTHNQIRDAVAKKVRKLFNLNFIQIERKLITGIIDIFTQDDDENFVGIEIKKKASKAEHEQFIKYREEFNKLFGSKSRIIILSSCYSESLFKIKMEGIELWRYEIWWQYIKSNKKPKYKIEDIRVMLYDKETSYERLFRDKIKKLSKN